MKRLEPFKLDLSAMKKHLEKPVNVQLTAPKMVCHAMDVREHEMKSFSFVGDTKVLIAKLRGKLYALGDKCPHYGAPLEKGVLGDDRVRCPWHGACFKLETGDIEDFPGLDSLPCYKVEIDKCGRVMVQANLENLEKGRRIKRMAKRDPKNSLTYIVVGGGAAAGVCVETLRQEGFTGSVIMLTKESHLPYDRVKISKDFDVNIKDIELRTMAFYQEHDIEIVFNAEVVRANMEERTVTLANDRRFHFDKMFIGTGCKPKMPAIKGINLKNIFTVREYDDLVALRECATANKTVVCLGSSFIAMEMAQTIRSKFKSNVTVISRAEFPFTFSFGHRIGERVIKLYKDNNVEIITKSGVSEIIGNIEGKISHVILLDGTQLRCDILILGVGSSYNTEFLIGSGLPVNANGSVEADMNLETLIKGVYVGGDIANAPVFAYNNQLAVIGHYQLAQYHGRIAALHMIGANFVELRAVPYFFTNLFGYSFRYAGYGFYSDVLIDGDLEQLKFVAYFLNDQERVTAVASCGSDPIVAQYAEYRSQGRILRRQDLQDKCRPWYSRLQADIKCSS